MVNLTVIFLRFGARLKEQEAILVGELLRLFVGDVTLGLEIALIADQVDDRVGVSERARVRQPAAQVVIRRAARDVIDHEGACRTSVVAARDRTESLLSRRVPDLQFDLLARHLDYARAELYADRVRAIGHNYIRIFYSVILIYVQLNTCNS